MPTVKLPFAPEEAQYNAATFPEYKKALGTNFPVAGLAFDAAADEFAFWKFKASNYGSGNLSLILRWYAATATANDVIWDACIAAITPDADSQDIETKAFAAISSVTDTHLGTTGKRLHTCTITISNLDSLAADDEVFLRLSRDANNGADTLAGDAILSEMELTYSDT